MIAGRLTETIVIARSSTSKNEFGATSNTWEDIITTKASVTQNTGNTAVVNNEIFTSYLVEFGIRSYHKVNEFDRVKWNGNIYRIESIVRDRRKNHITIISSLINE